jgi:phosphoribosylanthranilate isomerase
VGTHPGLSRALIAGGIGPANIRAASELGAYAMDVGSSVDFVPGIKSSAKIGSLFEALRPHARTEARLCA